MDVNIIGPFFFESTVNGANYLSMLNNEVLPVFAQKGMPLFFQQDGAPPHFALSVRQWLNEWFPERWIGRGSSIPWAPRSPDLNPLDFFYGVI